MGEGQRASYIDIKARVLAAIRDDTWPPGTVLPGEVDLAEAYGCARATVNRAMRELAAEGIIDRKRKAGTTVRRAPTRQARFTIPVTRDEVEAAGAVYRYALVTREERAAPPWLGARFGLGAGAPVLHLVSMHYADGEPFQQEERWINLSAMPRAASVDFAAISPNEWLVAEVPFAEAEVTFSACRADQGLAEFLGAAEGDALFRVERTARLENRMVTFARLIYRVGYQLRTRL